MHRLLALVLLAGLLLPNITLAFDPNYIISDSELTDAFSLDRNQIQAYLEKGYLANYKTADFEGVTRYAADIIWRAAQMHGVSPKFLLVLLQKEQSLVEDPSPTQDQLDWATGYAVCDDCDKDDPDIQRWKGFGKQVNSAALQFTEGYMADIAATGSTQGKFGPDIAVTIDGVQVIPENAATAAMYAYTPHLHGNENFTEIWDRWFGAEYPTGSLLQAVGQDGVYLIQYGYKRPITSQAALTSRFNKDLIIPVSATALESYPTGTPISLPNYSLLMDDDGAIFLLVDDSLRHIDSMETFIAVGFQLDEVVPISNAERVTYALGTPITGSTSYPTGALFSLSTTGTMFYVRDGQRQLVVDTAVAAANGLGETPIPVESVVIEQYKEGRPLKFPDGYLVKSAATSTVYVISEELLRAIPSEQIFTAYGWAWEDVQTVSDEALGLHAIGANIE